MLKILRATLQQYLKRELQYVQAGFRKARGLRYQICNLHWVIGKARELQKNFYLFDYAKALPVCITGKCKIIKEMGIPDHLTCLLKNRFTRQEATVRSGQGTTDSFKIGTRVH